jgi:hypothetical protein
MGFVTSPYPLLKKLIYKKHKQTNKQKENILTPKKTSYYITRTTSKNVC